MKKYREYKDYLAIFTKYGKTDEYYLHICYPRFCITQKMFYENWSLNRGKRLLDLGAHWLHQSVLYAEDGFSVTAADMPGTFVYESVKGVAREYDIALFPFQDLSDPSELCQFPDNSFDVIFFSEVLEHITFNPVAMWTYIYRLLSPGGRIVLTTPNYYYCQGRLWDINRVLTRMGGGITVNDIINTNTYGHHWKEYSAREIKKYFELLSPDFTISRLSYRATPYLGDRGLTSKEKLFKKVEDRIPILRKAIHAEIDLREKKMGITAKPHWLEAPEGWKPPGSSA